MSIADHVVISITVAAGSPPAAGFGTPLHIVTSQVGAPARLLGPFADETALVGFGFATTDNAHLWAVAMRSQIPHPAQFFIGRVDATDETVAIALPLIEAEGPGDYYGVTLESRDSDDILALATFLGPKLKIGITQNADASMLSDTDSTALVDTITFAGTETDGSYVITIIDKWTGATVQVGTVVRATTPATNADLAAAMITDLTGGALDAIATIGGSGDDVVITYDEAGHGFKAIVSAPAPGTLASVQVITQNPGELLDDRLFQNTALLYHGTNSQLADAAWIGRGLGFDLNSEKGFWSYKRLTGITGSDLTSTEKANLRGHNTNYNAPITATSGVAIDAFTFQGTMAGGRQIDQTTTIHWVQARMEEAMLGVLLGSALGVGFDDDGFELFASAGESVFVNALNAKHIIQRKSVATGRITPYIDVVALADVTAADETASKVRMSGEFHVRKGALRVVFNITANLEG